MMENDCSLFKGTSKMLALAGGLGHYILDIEDIELEPIQSMLGMPYKIKQYTTLIYLEL
jgi:hypothetical protein